MPEPKTINPSLVARIVRSYVVRNALSPGELSNLITTVHRSLTDLGAPVPQPASTPAVAVNRSYGRDFVICLECGRRGVMLRRHLTVSHGLSPREYRSKWGLKDTHPIVAPAYAARRSTLAKQLGLGHSRQSTEAAPAPPAPTPKRRGRPRRATPLTNTAIASTGQCDGAHYVQHP
jgi:predicted transcriptional regulator